jgi:hypothetical protein
MDFNTILWTILITLVIIIISALPLHLAVVFLNGRTSILRTFLVMLVVGVLSSVVISFLPFWGVFIAWILLIWIFHEMFRLKWVKAVIAWVLWLIFIIIMGWILSVFGLSLAAYSII